MASHREITPKSSMQDVLEMYPSAQRALFDRYHIGGCSSCGFQSTDALEEVLRNHQILDVQEVVGYIKRSQEEQDKLQIPPR